MDEMCDDPCIYAGTEQCPCDIIDVIEITDEECELYRKHITGETEH